MHLSTKVEDVALTVSKTWEKAEVSRGMLTFISVVTCSHKFQYGAKHLILYPQESEIEKRTGLDILGLRSSYSITGSNLPSFLCIYTD